MKNFAFTLQDKSLANDSKLNSMQNQKLVKSLPATNYIWAIVFKQYARIDITTAEIKKTAKI